MTKELDKVMLTEEIFKEIDLNTLVDWITRCKATLSDSNMSNALAIDGLNNIEKFVRSKLALKERYQGEKK